MSCWWLSICPPILILFSYVQTLGSRSSIGLYVSCEACRERQLRQRERIRGFRSNNDRLLSTNSRPFVHIVCIIFTSRRSFWLLISPTWLTFYFWDCPPTCSPFSGRGSSRCAHGGMPGFRNGKCNLLYPPDPACNWEETRNMCRTAA